MNNHLLRLDFSDHVNRRGAIVRAIIDIGICTPHLPPAHATKRLWAMSHLREIETLYPKATQAHLKLQGRCNWVPNWTSWLGRKHCNDDNAAAAARGASMRELGITGEWNSVVAAMEAAIAAIAEERTASAI